MLLTVSNLEVRYGVITALHDVSLQIGRGEIVALIGSNGAGKTTLLRTVSGLLRPTRGSIEWNPASDASAAVPAPPAESSHLQYAPVPSSEMSGLHRLTPHDIVRLGISHVPEGRQIFANLTVRENLMLGAYQRKDRQAVQEDLQRCYTLFPILDERRNQNSGTLSGGEQQMLAIGRALMARPQLLLLDEPSLGLAPLVVRKIFEIIKDINRAGVTIFLVEQNAHMALTIAHRGYVMQTGHIIMSADAAQLLADPEVKKAYLGG